MRFQTEGDIAKRETMFYIGGEHHDDPEKIIETNVWVGIIEAIEELSTTEFE